MNIWNFIVTDRSRADCKDAIHLIKNINAKLVFADRDYDANKILFYLNQRNIKPVIISKHNCQNHSDYAYKLYCFHHTTENTFLTLKRWRGISTRYAKTLDAFIVSVFVRCFSCYFNSFFYFFSCRHCLEKFLLIMTNFPLFLSLPFLSLLFLTCFLCKH